ncbi:MAG: hypothetical protein IID49_13005 [Proteobacteria bacterium]|nr:hypothetical protein [Pseudomonadota bacterium]
MDKLLDLLFDQTWWLVLALAVYGFCWATYRDLYANEPSRKRWIGYLAQNTWSNRYRKVLGNMLDWVDARLTPEISDPEKLEAGRGAGGVVTRAVEPLAAARRRLSDPERDRVLGGDQPGWRDRVAGADRRRRAGLAPGCGNRPAGGIVRSGDNRPAGAKR